MIGLTLFYCDLYRRGLFIEPRNVTHVLSDSGLGAVWGERSRPASGSTTPARKPFLLDREK